MNRRHLGAGITSPTPRPGPELSCGAFFFFHLLVKNFFFIICCKVFCTITPTFGVGKPLLPPSLMDVGEGAPRRGTVACAPSPDPWLPRCAPAGSCSRCRQADFGAPSVPARIPALLWLGQPNSNTSDSVGSRPQSLPGEPWRSPGLRAGPPPQA